MLINFVAGPNCDAIRIEVFSFLPFNLRRRRRGTGHSGQCFRVYIPHQIPENRADWTGPNWYLSISCIRQCLPNSLDAKKVKGKIVTCLRGAGLRVAKGLEVKRAGGAAIILGNSVPNGNEIPVDAHVLAGTAVSSDGAIALLKYINSSSNPTAKIVPARTVLHVSPAPVITSFSSRGPNRIAPNLLKVNRLPNKKQANQHNQKLNLISYL